MSKNVSICQISPQRSARQHGLDLDGATLHNGYMTDEQLTEMAQQVVAGNRRALARAITLVESGRSDHRASAMDLLSRLGSEKQAIRIGLSGTPGVGKSTFIESFGLMLTAQGLKVAVLAVDPSSARSGGSILGDKTRMDLLSRDPNAFIRPSPSQSQLGGVARRTREAISLCEAAGYDIVLIETVGVGQSETVVSQMADLFLLLLAPAGGDELQGVKRGIMEMADIILVNKADGELKAQAMRTCADYAGALHLLRKRPQDPDGYPKALTVSALEVDGLDTGWDAMQTLINWRRDTGVWDKTRAEQARYWFGEEVHIQLLERLHSNPEIRAQIDLLQDAVAGGEITATAAAAQVIKNL